MFCLKGSIEKLEAVASTQGHTLDQAAGALVNSQSIGGLGTGGHQKVKPRSQL